MSMPSHTENQEHHDANRDGSFESHSTTAGRGGRWSTKRIAIYALFVALTIVLSYVSIPIFPAAPFLKYDPSGIVVLVAGFAFGPLAAAVVGTLGFVPHIFSNPFGALIAIIVALALGLPAAFIYKRIRTRKGAVIGILVGSVAGLAAAILCNVIITPIYAHMSFQQVLGMIIPVLLPFNLMKFAIHGVITFLIYKPISVLVNH